MGTLANSEDPDEMQHNLYCLLRLKQPSGTEKHNNLENSIFDPLKVHNGQPLTYRIKMYGKIH